MKLKLSKIIVIFIILIIFMRVSYLFLRKEFSNDYKIKYNEYEIQVEEFYKQSDKDNLYSYIFNIDVENVEYQFQIFNKFNKRENIIKKIYYYSDVDYKCIFPVFEDNIQYVDVTCVYNDEYIYYHNILNPSEKLEEFVNSIKEYNSYNYNQKVDYIDNDNISFNSNYNAIGILTNYKGYYDLKTKEKIQLFTNDVYSQPISTFVNEYYIVADYNQTYEFDKIFVIDITNGKKREIVCYPKISFDSYIQGSIDNFIYLYDRKNKKQYKIDVQKLTVEVIGDSEKGVKIYKKSGWDIESSSDCSNNTILFDDIYTADITDSTYEKIDKVGINLGNYYFYKKENEIYNVYKSTLQDKNKKTYIFSTKTIDRIRYHYDKIFYIDEDTLKVYSDEIGETTILKFNELKFNDDIKFNIYNKKK